METMQLEVNLCLFSKLVKATKKKTWKKKSSIRINHTTWIHPTQLRITFKKTAIFLVNDASGSGTVLELIAHDNGKLSYKKKGFSI